MIPSSRNESYSSAPLLFFYTSYRPPFSRNTRRVGRDKKQAVERAAASRLINITRGTHACRKVVQEVGKKRFRL